MAGPTPQAHTGAWTGIACWSELRQRRGRAPSPTAQRGTGERSAALRTASATISTPGVPTALCPSRRHATTRAVNSCNIAAARAGLSLPGDNGALPALRAAVLECKRTRHAASYAESDRDSGSASARFHFLPLPWQEVGHPPRRSSIDERGSGMESGPASDAERTRRALKRTAASVDRAGSQAPHVAARRTSAATTRPGVRRDPAARLFGCSQPAGEQGYRRR